MDYLLADFTRGELIDKKYYEFNTEKGLIAFLMVNFKTEGFKVHKVLKEAVEYEVKYDLRLQPAKRRPGRKAEKEAEEAVVPIPEETETIKSKKLENWQPGPGPKCSQCGRKIAAHNKTGICTPCQLGKKTKSKK